MYPPILMVLNYRLGFSKLLGKLVVIYVSTYTKGIKQSAKDLSKDAYAMFLYVFFFDFLYLSICCGYSFELHQQVEKSKSTMAVI